jgi:hypothetical protein
MFYMILTQVKINNNLFNVDFAYKIKEI